MSSEMIFICLTNDPNGDIHFAICQPVGCNDIFIFLPSFEKVPETLEKTTVLLQSVDNHYSHDNITMRDNWMQGVNNNIDEIHQWMQEMKAKLDKNSEDTLAIRIDNMRTVIIDFASFASDANHPVTKEQFKRIFKLHTDIALAYLGITTPEEIEYEGETYVKGVNGYILKGMENKKDVKRGLYMLSIPSDFIFRIQLTEFAHVYKERNEKGTANPEVKIAIEAMADQLESATRGYVTRELLQAIPN